MNPALRAASLIALVAATACAQDDRRTVQAPRTGANAPALLPPAQRADRIVIDKSERRMELLREGRVIGRYRIDLGDAPQGHKQRRGDERTPEGEYRISDRNPNSAFHLSLRVSYPNERDRDRAREHGADPGGDIMIHGGSARWWREDWTDGCAAVSDAEIEEIWRRVPTGTPIRIEP
ncbi:L,D-transpeptidase family protein [Lysobacter sp. cf310]|uniref:L,D-transpeptidase family protein n=1 Tax=Lysobacter sp. cf310 TaxID=1761790 RepID=UPI0008F1C050|nr:L,D-transpeptidase family protein [Lysobacter sp. cf310]SFK75174.1 L,D-transpeptidase catalytic domain [Lysobacter sp. cf310]